MTLIDESPPEPVAEAKSPRRPAVSLVHVLAALVGVAAVAMVLFGALWVGTLWGLSTNSSDLAFASERDAVLVDAQQAAINLNTLDASKVNEGLDLWEQSSTGPTLEEFKRNRADYAKVVADSKRVTVAKVTDSAVQSVDVRAGTAQVMIGLDVEVRPEGQDPVVTRQRLQLEMTRTDTGWKVSRLSPVRAPAS